MQITTVVLECHERFESNSTGASNSVHRVRHVRWVFRVYTQSYGIGWHYHRGGRTSVEKKWDVRRYIERENTEPPLDGWTAPIVKKCPQQHSRLEDEIVRASRHVTQDRVRHGNAISSSFCRRGLCGRSCGL